MFFICRYKMIIKFFTQKQYRIKRFPLIFRWVEFLLQNFFSFKSQYIKLFVNCLRKLSKDLPPPKQVLNEFVPKGHFSSGGWVRTNNLLNQNQPLLPIELLRNFNYLKLSCILFLNGKTLKL